MPLALMHGASSSPSGVTVGTIPTNIPGIRIQSQVDCFGLGAVVHAAVTFKVVQWISIG